MNNISLSIVHTRIGRGTASLISLTKAYQSRTFKKFGMWVRALFYFCRLNKTVYKYEKHVFIGSITPVALFLFICR